MKEVRVSFHTASGVTSRVYDCAYYEESASGAVHLYMETGEIAASFARGVWTSVETVEAEEDPA